MAEIRLDLIYQEENAAAIDRAIARIKALSAAADENVRRMGAYAGGMFNARQMEEAFTGLGRLAGEYRAVENAARSAELQTRLVGVSARTLAQATASIPRISNVAEQQAYRREVEATLDALRNYQAVEARGDRFAARAAPRESVAVYTRAQAQAQAEAQRIATEARIATQRREMEQFNAELQAMGGRAFSPIRFEGVGAGLHAVRDDLKTATGEALGLGYALNRVTVELGEMARHARGQQISSLFSTIRRVGSIGALPTVAAVGGVLTAVELSHIATEMGHLAQETQNAAAATGMSVGQFSLLQRQIQLMGGSAQGAIRLFGFLGTAVDTALVNPLSDARGAFDQLGVSMEQLRAATQNPLALLDVLRQRFQSMDEAQRKLIFGRNFEALIPYLRMTQEEFDRTRATAERTGSVMGDETAGQLAKAAEASNRLSEAFTGLGIAITESTVSGGLINWLSSMVEGITRAIKVTDEQTEAVKRLVAAQRAMPTDIPPLSPTPTNEFAQSGAREGTMRGAIAAPSTADFTSFAQTLGLTSTQAAALAGQAIQESSLNPMAGAGGAHQGMFQWDAGRFAELKSYAVSIGQSWTDWKVQIQFIVAEIKKMAPEFFKAKTLAEQTKILTEQVEVPAGVGSAASKAEIAQRLLFAQSAIPPLGPFTTAAPPEGMTFAALNAPAFRPQQMERELTENIKVITNEFAVRIAQAGRDQEAVAKLEQERAQQELALRQQYAGRAGQFGAQVGMPADPEVQARLMGGTSAQVAAIKAQNTLEIQRLENQKKLVQAELELVKAPEKRLELENRIAQIDAQLAPSVQTQAVLELQLSKNAAEYTKELERQRHLLVERADVVAGRQERQQIQELKARAATDISITPRTLVEQEAAVTQQFLAEQEKRWQGARDAALKGSDAWIAAESKVEEVQAQAAEKQAELGRQLSDLARKESREYTSAFAQAFDSVGGSIRSLVNSDIKNLIDGWPKATQQVRYFETTSAQGLPIVGERVRTVSVAVQALQKIETSAAQAAVDLVLKLGEMAAVKGLGSMLGVATGPGTSAGSTIGGLFGALFGKLLGFSSGGIIPSAQGGMVMGTSGGQLALVHANEMVLPSPISQGFQDLLGKSSARNDINDPYVAASGGTTHFHIHAHDTQTGAQFLMRHASTIARAASAGLSRNAVTMRGAAG